MFYLVAVFENLSFSHAFPWTSFLTNHFHSYPRICDVLRSSSFDTPTEARDRASAEGNARAEDVVAIYRKRTHIDTSGTERISHVKYFVVDGVEALAKFGNDAWDRVVAVLTTGQAWQFKPYKWSEPRTLFHHGESLFGDLSAP